MAATRAHLDTPDLTWADVATRHEPVRNALKGKGRMPTPEDDGRTWALARVASAVFWAVDEGAEHVRLGACADDIDNFIANAVLTLLDTPDSTFEDIVTECYGEDPDEVSHWLRAAA
jgi:hypothetical protein